MESPESAAIKFHWKPLRTEATKSQVIDSRIITPLEVRTGTLSSGAWSTSPDDLLLLQISSCVDLHLSRNTLNLLRPRLCFLIVLKRDLFVYLDDSLTM